MARAKMRYTQAVNATLGGDPGAVEMVRLALRELDLARDALRRIPTSATAPIVFRHSRA